MTKKNLFAGFLARDFLSCPPLCSGAPPPRGGRAPSSSRPCPCPSHHGNQIPAVLTVPTTGGRMPLVVMATVTRKQGRGGSFTRHCRGAGAQGNRQRSDGFPRMRQSTEPFTANNVTNMLADVDAARLFAVDAALHRRQAGGHVRIRMGGRLAIPFHRAGGLQIPRPAGARGHGRLRVYCTTFMGGEAAFRPWRKKPPRTDTSWFTTMFGRCRTWQEKVRGQRRGKMHTGHRLYAVPC
jgi:hypothetical protein